MNVLNWIMILITTIVVLACVIPLMTGKKYEPMLIPLSDEKFSMKYSRVGQRYYYRLPP